MTMRRFRRQRRRPAPTTDLRPPEARLESMLGEQHEDRRHRIFTRMLNDLDAGQDVAPWIAAVSSLRDRLIIGEAVSCYLAEMFVESALFKTSRDDSELLRIAGEMEAIEAADGLSEDEAYRLDDAPPEWLALNAAWEARADDILTRLFGAAHLDDLAALYIERRSEFVRRADDGRLEIFPEVYEDDEPRRGVVPDQ